MLNSRLKILSRDNFRLQYSLVVVLKLLEIYFYSKAERVVRKQLR